MPDSQVVPRVMRWPDHPPPRRAAPSPWVFVTICVALLTLQSRPAKVRELDARLINTDASRPAKVRELDARLINTDARDLTRFLHDKIRMTDAEIATAAGVRNEQSVRRWRSAAGKNSPRNTDRLDDFRAIVTLLMQSGVLYPEEIGRWLRSRISDLDYARPIVLIGQGKFNVVRRAADLHVQRLEGRVLASDGSSTFDDDIEKLFGAPSAEHAPDEDTEYMGHRAGGQTAPLTN